MILVMKLMKTIEDGVEDGRSHGFAKVMIRKVFWSLGKQLTRGTRVD